jgi:hypothetical protein
MYNVELAIHLPYSRKNMSKLHKISKYKGTTWIVGIDETITVRCKACYLAKIRSALGVV